ncbi:MAG: GGDEF domain-containing protein [Phycisphaerae bacterium]|nr:MAG: EAL domain-containing protein [Planctomycetia bacterium]RIK69608.1 MAG: GGDEF domain-containing protein [Planctomycetota bacterium]GJQ26794.1 MAG: GGDEF domain-containing protein [Phycisphaerae bacterium]
MKPAQEVPFSRFAFGLLAIIYAAEAAVMFILPLFLPANTPTWLEALADSTLLAFVAAYPVWRILCGSLRKSLAAQRAGKKRLAAIAARTRMIFDSALHAIVTMDAHGRITDWNPQAEKLFGWSADEAIGRDLAELIIPERFRAAHRAGLERFLQTGVSRVLNQRLELAALRRDGCEFPIELCVSVSTSEIGRTFASFISDISERRRSEVELRKLSRVVEQTPTPVIITDVEGKIEFVNQAFLATSGYAAGEVMGKNPRILKSGQTPAQQYADMWNQLKAGATWRGELCNRRKNGDLYWVLAVISPLKDAQGRITHYVGVQEDITLRKRMEDELRKAARTDALTGLANRALFSDRLHQAVLRARRSKDYRFAVLFLDFDRFKLINDGLGHDAGDELLRDIAERLRHVVRSGDSISREAREHTTARFGGDEFVMLLDGIKSPDDATIVADRLMTAFAQPFHVGSHEVFATASIGIVSSDLVSEVADVEEVLRNADTAMYEAKLAGKGRYVVFDASMRRRVEERLKLETDLRKALDGGQLFLMYQPIVSLETGEMDGVEALIRWKHPERGLIPPSQFVPIAEEIGLMVPIGEWVLRESCRQFDRWRQNMGNASPRSISVNLSRTQLAVVNLPAMIGRILEETGVPPSCLHLEITESMAMRDVEFAKRILHGLKQIGCVLCFDDFGTGHSSLSCLHEFPIDVLKIDRSFVANINRGRDFIALIHSANQLAHNLGIRVVAEGIESLDQVGLLLSINCEFGQGYLLGKPMTPEQVEKFRVQTGWLCGRAASEPDGDCSAASKQLVGCKRQA